MRSCSGWHRQHGPALLAAAEAAGLSLDARRVDLGEVAAAAAEQLERQFEATGVDLDVRLAPVVVAGDPQRLFWRGADARAAAGSGIGLTVVAELVRAHRERGGRHELGRGTRIVVTLPSA